jgi:hypothetical protein
MSQVIEHQPSNSKCKGLSSNPSNNNKKKNPKNQNQTTTKITQNCLWQYTWSTADQGSLPEPHIQVFLFCFVVETGSQLYSPVWPQTLPQSLEHWDLVIEKKRYSHLCEPIHVAQSQKSLLAWTVWYIPKLPKQRHPYGEHISGA